jgi:hypothetical protein
MHIHCHLVLPQGMDGSGGWGNTSGITLMQGDYPAALEVNQKAGSILIRDLQGHIPAGTYTLMYDGDGVVDCGAFDVAQIRLVAGIQCSVGFTLRCIAWRGGLYGKGGDLVWHVHVQGMPARCLMGGLLCRSGWSSELLRHFLVLWGSEPARYIHIH